MEKFSENKNKLKYQAAYGNRLQTTVHMPQENSNIG